MKLSRKAQNVLFVEEERYNWAPVKSSVNRKLVYLSVMILIAAMLFSTLR